MCLWDCHRPIQHTSCLLTHLRGCVRPDKPRHSEPAHWGHTEVCLERGHLNGLHLKVNTEYLYGDCASPLTCSCVCTCVCVCVCVPVCVCV